MIHNDPIIDVFDISKKKEVNKAKMLQDHAKKLVKEQKEIQKEKVITLTVEDFEKLMTKREQKLIANNKILKSRLDRIEERQRNQKRIDFVAIKNNMLEEMDIVMKDRFDNLTFATDLKTQILKNIIMEVKAEFSQEGIRDVIKDIIINSTKDIYETTVRDIVQTITKHQVKKLDYEYRVAKDLCASIDSTIRHTMMHLPISAIEESKVKSMVTNCVKKISNNFQLSVGKDKKMIEQR